MRNCGWSDGQPRRWMHGPAWRTPPTAYSCASGSNGAMTSAKTAAKIRIPSSANPTIAERWRRICARVSRHRLAGRRRASSRSTSWASMTSVVAISAQADAWIDEGVEHIDHEVHDEVADGGHQRQRLDHDVVAAQDRLGQRPSQPGKVEDRLGQDGTGQERPQRQADHRYYRQ